MDSTDAESFRKSTSLSDAKAAAARLIERVKNGRPEEFDLDHEQLMLREHLGDPTVADSVRQAYDLGGILVKLELMWDMLLLDRSLVFQKSVHVLIKENTQKFRTVIEGFYGTDEDMRKRLVHRIEDSSVPDSKKWIYLWCMVGVAGDARARAMELLRSVARKDDHWRDVFDLAFASTVAEDVLAWMTTPEAVA